MAEFVCPTPTMHGPFLLHVFNSADVATVLRQLAVQGETLARSRRLVGSDHPHWSRLATLPVAIVGKMDDCSGTDLHVVREFKAPRRQPPSRTP